MGKLTINGYCSYIYPLVVNKHNISLTGKLMISMAMFNGYVANYQRVNMMIIPWLSRLDPTHQGYLNDGETQHLNIRGATSSR